MGSMLKRWKKNAYAFEIRNLDLLVGTKSKSKAKPTHLEDNLVIIKDPKGRVCVYKKYNTGPKWI